VGQGWICKDTSTEAEGIRSKIGGTEPQREKREKTHNELERTKEN
jgi:hypothetical protein